MTTVSAQGKLAKIKAILTDCFNKQDLDVNKMQMSKQQYTLTTWCSRSTSGVLSITSHNGYSVAT